MTGSEAAASSRTVTVLVCTKRPAGLKALFANYRRQTYRDKELVVLLNKDSLDEEDYRRAASGLANIRIYRMPEYASLGQCLNAGVRLSRSPFIAKFDDDDYYAPHYLSESMRTLLRSDADVVGKRAHYMYLSGKKLLLHRYRSQARRFVPLVQGATLLIRRRVFDRVAFPNRSHGECVKFCADCLAKGYAIYAGSPYNFLAIRSKNPADHTWTVSDRELLKGNVKVLRVRDVRRYVRRG